MGNTKLLIFGLPSLISRTIRITLRLVDLAGLAFSVNDLNVWLPTRLIPLDPSILKHLLAFLRFIKCSLSKLSNFVLMILGGFKSEAQHGLWNRG